MQPWTRERPPGSTHLVIVWGTLRVPGLGSMLAHNLLSLRVKPQKGHRRRCTPGTPCSLSRVQGRRCWLPIGVRRHRSPAQDRCCQRAGAITGKHRLAHRRSTSGSARRAAVCSYLLHTSQQIFGACPGLCFHTPPHDCSSTQSAHADLSCQTGSV